MSYLCIKKQEPTAGAKGILCGGVFLPIESYESEHPTPASQIPAEGLALYVPLSEESSTAETGQALTKNGTVTYETLAGIPCITKGNTNAYLSAPLSVEGAFTLSFWINTTYTGEYIGMAYVGGLCIFDASSNSNLQFSAKKNSSERVNFTGISKPLKWRDGAWHHIALSITSTESKLYCDGTLISTASGVNISTSSNAYIGWDNDGDNAAASYARWRVYNRALTDAEIALLAREFVFNPAPLAGRKGLLVPVGESVAAPPANGLVFNASYAEDMTDSDGESPVDGTGYTIVEDAAGFKCLNVEKSNMQDSMYYDGTQEKMQFGTGNFAVGFYLKSVKPWSDYNGIVLANVLADSGFTGFVFYKNRDSGKKSMVVRFGTGTDIYSESDVDTNWHHWLFMRDGDTVKLYKDGKVDATMAYSGTVNAHEDLYIGGYYSNWSSFTSAYFRLSNVRIYNRALTDAEIQSVSLEHNPAKSLFIPLQTAYGTPQAGQKGIIVRSSQVVGHAVYSKSAEAMPTEGLVFYLPCDSDSYTTAQTGQTLSKSGTVTATTVNGIPCLEIKSGSYLNGTLNGFSGDVSMALSFWFKRLDSNSSAYITAGRGSYSLSGGNEIWASVELDHIETACGSSGSDARRAGIYNATIGTGWHHGYFSYDATSKKFKTVLDGDTENAGYSAERSYNFSSGLTLCINSLARATSAIKGNANYSQIRIFNRALTDAEIKTLAGEYKQEEIKKMFIAVKGTEIADIPQDGLIFHAPFNGNTTPNVGTMVLVGNEGDIAYNTQDGITYAVLPGTFGWRIYAQGTTDLTVGNEYSYICYYRDDSDHSKSRRFLINMNLGSRYQNTYAPNSVNKLNVCDRTIDSSSGKWHFICIRSNGSVASIKGFLDTSTWTSGAPGNSSSRTDSFLAAPSDWATSSQGQFWHGGIFDFAVYNRILTDAEVENLYQRIFWLQA